MFRPSYVFLFYRPSNISWAGKLWSSVSRHFPYPPFALWWNVLLGSSFPYTLNRPLEWHTKFHIILNNRWNCSSIYFDL
jgi:hypothetical protein